jgi:hypothetical protein
LNSNEIKLCMRGLLGHLGSWHQRPDAGDAENLTTLLPSL